MELFQEILQTVFEKEEIQVSFPNVSFSAAEIVEGESYRTLQKIKAVIEDDGLEDKECFMKIEKIVCLLEEIGSDGGNRHDF